MVFTGTYQRTLDGKLRVLLPKRLRAAMSGPGTDGGLNLFLTPGTDHCLELHTTQSLNELAIRASQSPAGSKNVRSFSRLFYARAQQCDVDKQGRIRIPLELAGLADLTREIVFIGVGFHWELWNRERWESYLETNDGAFDHLAEVTFDGSLESLEQSLNDEHPQTVASPRAESTSAGVPAMSVQQQPKPK